jgi:hypothetical protein
MAAADEHAGASPSSRDVQLTGGTYEVIRNRLTSLDKELTQRLDRLHQERRAVFGTIDLSLLTTERITTTHNCVPRDMVVIGNRLLLGYNVQFGLKVETVPTDVFAVYAYRDRGFHETAADILDDTRFQNDFRELYRYYRQTTFAQFAVLGPHLHMVFRIGKSVSDIKTFKWLIQDESLQYVDNRSEHECRLPAQHAFEWKRTQREAHQFGPHPHVAIADRLFVETVGGDLTIKIENNTQTGEGIYSEPVENADQTLDDAEMYYAILGSIILLKIRPYQERAFRYIAYNEKVQQAQRLDAIETSCVLLPDDHGIVFSRGYYLQTGECKVFESDLQDMLFMQCMASPNGEDFLYVFYNRDSGIYLLLPYNLIDQSLGTPIVCNGYALFEQGELILGKASGTPQKHHAVQVWQSPFLRSDSAFMPAQRPDSYLSTIGSRELVQGMAECHEILTLLRREDTYANLYVDLVKTTGDLIDAYFWLGHDEVGNLKEVLQAIQESAASAVGEFDKVVQVQRHTRQQVEQVAQAVQTLLSQTRPQRFDSVEAFVSALAACRGLRGQIISLRDLRYVDLSVVETLERDVQQESERLAQQCVDFLLQPDALAPYARRVADKGPAINSLTKVSDARLLEQDIDTAAHDLELLIETVSQLAIDDATKRTDIIDRISEIFSALNQVRARLKHTMHALARGEGEAECHSQLKLLNQAVVNYLDLCDTPEKCEAYLTKLMVQLEELEGKFAEFDEFVLQLADKRTEIYNAFDARKVSLVEQRNKRTNTLMQSAQRVLHSLKARVEALTSIDAINGFFAADLLVDKVRDIARQLRDLDDSVKADDIHTRLKTLKEDALRQLKDRLDLYADDGSTIRLGAHQFSVNVQPLDLTTLRKDDGLYFHLSGTRFFERIADDEINTLQDVWDQEVVSETTEVYRGEYLAYQMFTTLDAAQAEALLHSAPQELLREVQRFMGSRYSEGYVKGVHDHDAALLLQALLEFRERAKLLRYHTQARALARLYWHHVPATLDKALMQAQLAGLGMVLRAFAGHDTTRDGYVRELRAHVETCLDGSALFSPDLLDEAAAYLFDELTTGGAFCISHEAAAIFREFHAFVQDAGLAETYATSAQQVDVLWKRFRLVKEWVLGFLTHTAQTRHAAFADEVTALLLEGACAADRVLDVALEQRIDGLLGTHALLQQGSYTLDYPAFVRKLKRYVAVGVPRFERLVQRKRELVERARVDFKLDELQPRVLTSFVRNKLIDTVYLPLIGDNLAKQIGAVGDAKRTDSMGLLLIISPPGYGKTTLMEYIANRLGLIFMKINGPALGNDVTSLDPSEGSNAAAREELEKLNLALEMGDNLMLYVDDIQHCHAEFLQKFISLCDAQRKIEGVYKGRTRTYDLRGRRVAVVMAGNPYTESGEKFHLPDMLANRADTYNLGEIIGDNADAFIMSYLENAITSNAVLSRLASTSQHDVYAMIQMAERDSREGIELAGNYALAEIQDMVSTMRKLMQVRDVVLTVNREYIRSASQAEEFRTEPPFKLQGSYRNMNRIAERVLPIMNDAELRTLIASSYDNDAQTLTTGAEANLLKFKELTGALQAEEAERWASIKKTYQRNIALRGLGSDDKFAQVVLALNQFNDSLEAIQHTIAENAEKLAASGVMNGHDSTQGEPQVQVTERQQHEIQIINRVPRIILEVIQQQFTIMQKWLHPLHQATQDNGARVAQLEQVLQQTLHKYTELLSRLEDRKIVTSLKE